MIEAAEAFCAHFGSRSPKLQTRLIQTERAASATTDGLLRQWPAPDTGLQKHYGYAFQWFSLSVLTLGLYVWFQVIRPRRRVVT